MSLSACSKCWETLCECGHEYESWSKERIEKLINTLQRVLKAKKMKEFNKLKGQVSFFSDRKCNTISVGDIEKCIDVWGFGLDVEEHAELTTVITKAIKVKQDTGLDPIELLKQRNEFLTLLKNSNNMLKDCLIETSDNKDIEYIKELIFNNECLISQV